MKEHGPEMKMKKHILFQDAGSQSRRAATFVSAGLAGLFAVALAFSALLVVPGSHPGTETETTVGKKKGNWYFRLGQWRADARTLVAMVRFVIEPDNDITANYAITAETLPTNSVLSCVGCSHGVERALQLCPVVDARLIACPARSEPL